MKLKRWLSVGAYLPVKPKMAGCFLAAVIGIFEPEHRQNQILVVLYGKLAVVVHDEIGNERPIVFIDGPFLVRQTCINEYFFRLLEENMVGNVAVALGNHVYDFAI